MSQLSYGTRSHNHSWERDSNRPIDWANLFNDSWGKSDDENGPWITPHMALTLFDSAYTIANIMEDDNCESHGGYFDPILPRIARGFFQTSKEWRWNFMECHKRIALRLSRGLAPEPNCTGEEMALHNVISFAKENEMVDLEGLPERPHDNNFEIVSEYAFKDHDVLMLFEDDDCGYDIGNDSEGNFGRITNFLYGERAHEVKAINLQPRDWFLAFDENRFYDDVIPPSESGRDHILPAAA